MRNPLPPDQSEISRGIFCSNVGIDRLLGLFDEFNIKSTWFTPSHSILSFRNQHEKVLKAGHEFGLHGYTHELVSELSLEQEREILAKSVEVMTEFTGKPPRGWTAPAWSPSKNSMKLLEEFGLEYDHSFMIHDCQMFYAPDASDSGEFIITDFSKSPSTWMYPMSEMKKSNIVTVPALWDTDDWPAFQIYMNGAPGQGHTDTRIVEAKWQEIFEYFYKTYDSFVFPISIHPQCSGKPHVLEMHRRFIAWINKHEGVEWMTFGEMADEFKAGKMPEFEWSCGAKTL